MSKQHFEIPEVATGGAAGLPTPQPPQTPEAVEDDRLFASAKAYLMQADADGQSVYDLLYRSVYAMLEENPEEVAAHPERLNEVLSSLKRHQFDGARVPTATARDVREVSKVHPTQTADAKRNLALLAQPKAKSETKIERPSPGVTVTTTTVLQSSGPSFQSVAKDNAMWRFCGHGLPEQEAFLLDQSIARLARDKKLEEVRFVGKIFGLRANYLVVSSRRWIDPSGAEAVYTERYGMPKPPRKNTTVDVQPEPAYKGVNQKSFWVAPEAGAEWVLLPDTTPQNINAARTVNKLFTGDLNAPVVVHPPFHADGTPATEREYLRAQLSRIVAATYISPSGALERYEPEEDDEEEEEDDEPLDEDGKPKPPRPAKYRPLTVASKDYNPDAESGAAALADLEQWVHSEQFIYKDGRMTRLPPKPEEDDEEEEPEEPEDEEEEEGNAEPPQEEEEEEDRDLFQAVKRDYLYSVVTVPREPNPDDEEGEDEFLNENAAEEEPLDAEALAEKEREEEEALKKPVDDDDVADDDPLKKKVTAWTAAVVNAIYKRHGIAAIRSVRWPGAIAFAGNGGKAWGAVYLGDGLKKTDYNFVPTPAPRIQRECKDLTEAVDPTAANEKLVMRGEDPREEDSEDEQPDEEEEEN